MCDDGRYGYKFVHADERLTSSKVRQGEQLQEVNANQAVDEAARLLAPYLNEDSAEKLAVVISPAVSCEEQFLLAQWIRSRAEKANLVMGPVFSDEKDETFKCGFTISAEKVPNRRGAQQILKHFAGTQMNFKKLLDAVAKGKIEAVWLQGGYPWLDWCPAETVEKIRQAKVLIVQDILKGDLSDVADVLLAGAAWAQKNGCFINDQDICQTFNKAIDPPGDVRDDLEMLGRLIDKRKGLTLQEIRSDMSVCINVPTEEDLITAK
jgi:predicted molibdopterin-dependent oxidoreductase YjgC